MRCARWFAAAVAAVAFTGVIPPGPAQAEGAVVINDIGCTLLTGDGGFAFTDSSHAVVTPSANGVLKCKAEVAPATSGTAAHFDYASTGLLCSTPAGSTTDWKETVSASGRATLTCKVH